MADYSQANSSIISPLASLHLLVVENVQEDAELMILTLETAGIDFTYQVVDTLDQYRTLLLAEAWDAILSDYRLVGFTAYEVLAGLQATELDIPFILVTGSLGEESAVECIKAGMTDYVLKERLFRLPMVLERSLQEAKLRREKQAALLQLQQQATRETIINRIVQAMRGSLVMAEVLQTTADRLHEVLNVSRCLIFLPDATGTMQCQYVSHATCDREPFLGVQCGLFEYYAQGLNAGGQICPDLADPTTPATVRRIMQEYGMQSVLMTPLVHQQRYQGGICLQQCDYQRQWTPNEQAMLAAIADQCAIALHQSQLFQQVQQQAHQEQLLNQIGRVLNSSLDPDYILQEIVKVTGECLQVERVTLFTVKTDRVHITHEWLASDSLVATLGNSTPIGNWLGVRDPATGEFFREPYHLPDATQIGLTPEQIQCFEEKQTRSLLSLPIYIHDEFAGGIELHTGGYQRTFSPAEIQLLQRIADQAAIALYNAHSYERLEAQVKERTQELEEAKRVSDAASQAKSDFLANMSHELRTPLTSILGFSSVLLKQVFGRLNDKQEQYLSSIYTSGEHLLELINDLLDLSKIEAGREELMLEIIEVEGLCAASLEYVRAQADKKGLLLTLAIAPNSDYCTGDRRRLKQILVNLLSNAVKFTEFGSVSLAVTRHSDQLQFQVRDTGIGIDPSHLSSLFQPFHQLQSGLDRKYQGTGLGLALARRLAQLHGGTITVTSTLGEGSCFTLHLPLTTQPDLWPICAQTTCHP